MFLKEWSLILQLFSFLLLMSLFSLMAAFIMIIHNELAWSPPFNYSIWILTPGSHYHLKLNNSKPSSSDPSPVFSVCDKVIFIFIVFQVSHFCILFQSFNSALWLLIIWLSPTFLSVPFIIPYLYGFFQLILFTVLQVYLLISTLLCSFSSLPSLYSLTLKFLEYAAKASILPWTLYDFSRP